MYFRVMNEAKTPKFSFKKFSVSHHKSSMKVGVDAVLIGSWCNVEGHKGLDIGCGCGVIALMCAQRNPEAVIKAIDIHGDSVGESRENFHNSIWNEHLVSLEGDVLEFSKHPSNLSSFDFIVSNPPFFNNGLISPESARASARHEGHLTIHSLLEAAGKMLKPTGIFSLIIPYDRRNELQQSNLFFPIKECLIADSPKAPFKRIMVQLSRECISECSREILYIKNEDGSFSHPYKNLTKEFYLKF